MSASGGHSPDRNTAAGAPVSIRDRLGRALLQVSLAWALAVAGAVAWVAHAEVDQVLDGALQESAEILLGLLSVQSAALPLDRGDALPAPLHEERLVWQLVGPRQQVLLRSHHAPTTPLLDRPTLGLSDTPAGARVYGLAYSPAQAMLYVAQTEAHRSEASREAPLAVAVTALAVALVCVVWMRRRTAQELAPLRELSEQVQGYHPLDAGATLPAATRAELQPIRDAIVDLGDRLALRVDSERAITAHAAHALRTPLAGMTAQLAVAMREAPETLHSRLQRVRQASERLSRVVSALLTLFRSGVEPQWQEADLVALVAAVPVDGLKVTVQAGPPGAGSATSGPAADLPLLPRLRVDPDLLVAALMNLLDNAVRYGAREVQLQLSEAVEAGQVWQLLRVTDDGPGIPPERREQIQLALVDQSYEQAMGLGLMLTDLVVRAHRGRLRLLSPAAGFGLELRWPRAERGNPSRP